MTRFYHFYFFLILLLTSSIQAQVVDKSFIWDGLERSYRVVIPPGYEEGEALPLVFNFHGFTSNSIQQQIYSGMDQVADTANFFVVYPQGVGDAWNVGWIFGSNEDDVGFTNAMIDTLHATYGINLDKVYACGMSNGGFFSYRLACELNDRIAKVASVTGSIAPSQIGLCMPENPIPIMQIHGTADPVVNYEGGAGVSVGIEELLDTWIDINGCPLESDTIFVPDINTSDLCTAQLIQYTGCDDNVLIAFYKIINGGHTWPGSLINIGVTNQDFNASAEIWNFFNDRYPIDQLVNTEEPILNQVSLEVYPNPFLDYLMIHSNNTRINELRVVNALGQTLFFQKALNNNTFRLDGINWPAGFYFIQVRTSAGNQTIKIYKQ